ncbi:MAG: DNRLRE domain-containing protein [Bacteroidetes bacterium]|nr:DNRLRE domain-containing protein [Bacteroidota bacterium]
MFRQSLLVAVLIFSSFVLNAQTTISLRLDPNGADAAVDDWYPNGNYPNETDYCSGTWTINGTQVSWRSFLKFDLSMIPPGSIVNSAHLSLYYANPNSFNDQHQSLTSSNESVLQRVLDPWQENLVAWNNQPNVTSIDQVILPQSTSGTQDYTNMDVSAMVQEMVNSGNYGFGLRQVNEMPYGRMIFASGDHPDTNQRPLLIVNFTPQLTCLNLKLDKEGEDATVDDYNPANNNPKETTINWNNQPNTSNLNQVFLPQTTSGTQNFPNMDVSGMVQDMINNPGVSDGFMLKMANEIPYGRMIFASGDNPDTTLLPTLDICYYTLPTSIPTLETSSFEVFPNPSTSDIYIRWNPMASYRGLEILNPLGELIADFDVTGLSSFSVNAGSWAKGIYFIRLGDQPVQRICIQ